jgi:hypothetical protein
MLRSIAGSFGSLALPIAHLGLALVLYSFSDGGSEAALKGGSAQNHFCSVVAAGSGCGCGV